MRPLFINQEVGMKRFPIDSFVRSDISLYRFLFCPRHCLSQRTLGTTPRNSTHAQSTEPFRRPLIRLIRDARFTCFACSQVHGKRRLCLRIQCVDFTRSPPIVQLNELVRRLFVQLPWPNVFRLQSSWKKLKFRVEPNTQEPSPRRKSWQLPKPRIKMVRSFPPAEQIVVLSALESLTHCFSNYDVISLETLRPLYLSGWIYAPRPSVLSASPLSFCRVRDFRVSIFNRISSWVSAIVSDIPLFFSLIVNANFYSIFFLSIICFLPALSRRDFHSVLCHCGIENGIDFIFLSI